MVYGLLALFPHQFTNGEGRRLVPAYASSLGSFGNNAGSVHG
ncbi:hypothetical protein [Streptomyces sp. NPDC059209]